MLIIAEFDARFAYVLHIYIYIYIAIGRAMEHLGSFYLFFFSSSFSFRAFARSFVLNMFQRFDLYK